MPSPTTPKTAIQLDALKAYANAIQFTPGQQLGGGVGILGAGANGTAGAANGGGAEP